MKKILNDRFIVKFIVMCTTMMLMGALSGCGKESQSKDTDTRIVVDLEGNEIEVPSQITNYAVAWSGDLDILAMLDNCEHISAFPQQSLKFPMLLEFYPQLENCIQLPKINVSSESILESGAQVVFLRYSDYPELTEQLKQQNVPAININFENYEDMIKSVELVADVLNTDEARNEAKQYREYVEKTMEEAVEMASTFDCKDASLIVFRDAVDYTAYSPDRMIGAWTDLCGINYLIDTGESTANVNLTVEQILEYDPDYIFFAFPGNIEKFYENEKLASLKCVKEGNVYETPTVFSPFPINGAEGVLQLKWIFTIMSSDYTIDIEKEVRDFYREFYDIEFTDAQLKEILYGEK